MLIRTNKNGRAASGDRGKEFREKTFEFLEETRREDDHGSLGYRKKDVFTRRARKIAYFRKDKGLSRYYLSIKGCNKLVYKYTTGGGNYNSMQSIRGIPRQ